MTRPSGLAAALVVASLAAVDAARATAPADTAAASAADLRDIEHALHAVAMPRGGSTSAPTQPFLVLPPELVARLHVRAADLAAVDPGVACDAAPPAMKQASVQLGAAGSLQTICLPDGHSQGVLALADGSSYITQCSGPGAGLVRGSLSVTVGDHTLQASTGPDHDATPAPTHACSGWMKLPGGH